LGGGPSPVGERRETGGPRRVLEGPKDKRRHTARVAAKATTPSAREGSKKADVIELMRRPQGATLAEIMEQTGWQKHTVRGFVSGTLIKKLGLKVESFRSDEKERTYRTKEPRSSLPFTPPGSSWRRFFVDPGLFKPTCLWGDKERPCDCG
jgi:hypothetical protein